MSCIQEKCSGNGWPQIISHLNLGKTLQPPKGLVSPEDNLQNKHRGLTSPVITFIIAFIKIMKQMYTHKAQQYQTTRRPLEIVDTFQGEIRSSLESIFEIAWSTPIYIMGQKWL